MRSKKNQFPPLMQDVIASMLAYAPSERGDGATLLTNEWLTQYDLCELPIAQSVSESTCTSIDEFISLGR